MRDLAKLTSIIILGVGGFAGLILLVTGLGAVEDYGAAGWTSVGLAAAVLIVSASSACILSLLASIDARLEAGGMTLSSDQRPSSPAPASDKELFRQQVGDGQSSLSLREAVDQEIERRRIYGKE